MPAGLFGVFRLLVQLGDDGGNETTGSKDIADPVEITISIESRNEPPSFVIDSPVLEFNVTADPLHFPRWAMNLSAGAGECLCGDMECVDERFRCQNLTFSLVSVKTISGGRPSSTKLFESFEIDPVDGNLTFVPAKHWSGEFLIQVQVTDDGNPVKGGLDIGGSNSSLRNFTLVLNILNEVPTFKLQPYLLVPQATLPNVTQRFMIFENLTAGSGDVATEARYDPLVTVVSSNCSNAVKGNINCSGLFDRPPNVTSDGYIEFALAVAQFGEAILVLEVGNTGPPQDFPQVTFKIQVYAVNQPPSCSFPHPVFLREDAGPQRIPGFATGLSVGPPSESWQHLVFTVDVAADPPDLFAISPEVDAAGALLIHVGAARYGNATLHVTCRDNGGRDYGGIDTRAGGPVLVKVTVLANPRVQRVRPGMGSVVGGGAMTVMGRHFGSELSRGYRRDTYSGVQVLVRGVPCQSTVFRSDSEVVCQGMPPGNGPSTVSVEILDPNSGSRITPRVRLSGDLPGAFSYHSFFAVGTLSGEVPKGFLGLGFYSPPVAPRPFYESDNSSAAANSTENGTVGDAGEPRNRKAIGEIPGRGARGRLHVRELGVSGAVHTVAPMDGSIYIGGSFISTATEATSHLAVLDTSGYAMAVANGVDGSVDAMTIHQGYLIIGGTFTYAYPLSGRAVPCGGLASYDTTTSRWGIVGRSPLNGAVKALLSHHGELYVGGRFKTHAGQQAEGIAVHSGWIESEGGWKTIGGVGGGYVMVMASFHNEVSECAVDCCTPNHSRSMHST